MDLNSDLILLQGILNNCVKRTGEFTRINYRGGNEQLILSIVEEIFKFLSERDYIQDRKPRKSSTEQLNRIVLFLGINTVFKKELIFEEFSHLTGIIPKLSKCLLANICYGLDLVPQYGRIIMKFPLNVTQELVDQIIECLKKDKPNEQLEKAFIILKAVVEKLSSTEFCNQVEYEVEEIVHSSNEVMRHLTGVGVEYLEQMKEMQIYEHMGFTLLNFFDVLLDINEKQPIMRRILECMLATCCNIFSTVSVNVFCAWAEIQYEDQPLQIILAGKAFLIIEKYKKFEPAKELVNMVSTIAKKPKSLNQLITEAHIPTIIRKAGEESPDQCRWFKAMMNLQLFQHKDAINVLERYHFLCDEDDILRLLSLPITEDIFKNNNLILKCASNLKSSILIHILIRHFHDKDFQWSNDTQAKLTAYFNKLVSEIDEASLKEGLLLMLQNVPLFFYHLYSTILKGSQGAIKLNKAVCNIAVINNVDFDSLNRLLEENKPNEENIKGYFKLFSGFVDCGFSSIVIEILLLKMKGLLQENELESLQIYLMILKTTLSEIFQTKNASMDNVDLNTKLVKFLLTCSKYTRCKSFLDFNSLKSEINSLCVAIIRTPELIKCLKLDVDISDTSILNDPWTIFYVNLISSEKSVTLLSSVLPEFDLNNYTSGNGDENFTGLLKILPCCAPLEWTMILNELEQKYSFKATVDILSDIVILLCEFSQSQNLPVQQADKLLPPLKYCLQNYGKVLETLTRQSKDNQISAVNNLCRVLKHTPEPLKLAEGVALIQMIPDEILRSLSNDKEFVAKIVLIGDRQLCKVLAQKVLGS